MKRRRRTWTAKDIHSEACKQKDASGKHRPNVEENRGGNAAKSL